MVSGLVIIFVALVWILSYEPTSAWGVKPQTWHTILDRMLPCLAAQGYLYCLAWSSLAVMVQHEKSLFCNNVCKKIVLIQSHIYWLSARVHPTIYSSSSPNTVKTTWYYSEDKVSLHAGANIFRYKSSFACLYTSEYRPLVGQLIFPHSRPLIDFQMNFVKLLKRKSKPNIPFLVLIMILIYIIIITMIFLKILPTANISVGVMGIMEFRKLG